MFQHKRTLCRVLCVTLLVTGTALLYGASGQLRADNLPVPPASPAVITAQAITLPSAKYNVSFMAPGIVHEMQVKPFDVVEMGQVLATEDTDLEVAQLKSMQIQANSTREIEAAVKERMPRKFTMKLLKDAAANGGTNPQELREAELDYQVAELKILVAQEEHEEKLAEVDKQKVKIEKMTLRSPVKGKAWWKR